MADNDLEKDPDKKRRRSDKSSVSDLDKSLNKSNAQVGTTKKKKKKNKQNGQ